MDCPAVVVKALELDYWGELFVVGYVALELAQQPLDAGWEVLQTHPEKPATELNTLEEQPAPLVRRV